MTKYIFITGGVVSSLGKGIAASSLAAILESRGLKVTMTKLDPYINVDPGTMSPFQHGEVFVTEDGDETDEGGDAEDAAGNEDAHHAADESKREIEHDEGGFTGGAESEVQEETDADDHGDAEEANDAAGVGGTFKLATILDTVADV